MEDFKKLCLYELYLWIFVILETKTEKFIKYLLIPLEIAIISPLDVNIF